MGLFGFGKKEDDVVDLAEKYRIQRERIRQEQVKSEKKSSERPPTFFQGLVNAAQKQNEANEAMKQTETADNDMDVGDDIDERRKKLTKRLVEMTNKMEELSNQIYHLQQRIELLERKLNVKLG